MYFQCTNNRVIEEQYEMTNAFRRREYIEGILKANDMGENHRYLWEKNTIKPKESVEGFYLVHESLFEEVLSQYVKGD